MCETIEKYHQEVNTFRSSVRQGYVLFVDDNADLTSLLCQVALSYGENSKACNTKEDALTILMNDYEHIKCVVVDLHLNGLDMTGGEEIIDFLENHESRLPYVVYTGDPLAGAHIKKKHRRSTIVIKSVDTTALMEAAGIADKKESA